MANDLRDVTANLSTEVCPNVCIEPPLQALTGELPLHNSSISEDGEMTSFFTVQHVGVDSEDICGSCNMTAVAVISSVLLRPESYILANSIVGRKFQSSPF